MPDTTLILVAVLVAAVLLVLAALLWRRGHSRTLRRQFGPEYERAVHEAGSRKAAEHELERRRDRVEKVSLRELDAEERKEFGARWRRVQADFVDRPWAAVESADKLVTEVMLARGYPAGDFQQRVADASVGHADVVADYRQARLVAEKSRGGKASTEELRQSLVCYRNIFQEMLGIDEVPPVETARGEAARQARPH
jgi:hypothetical protein